ncbi:DegT/DnrJ/EryC1/StrS family aminotransferase [Nitrosomonadales bacterium]|nr:DegT/DnrJ/EryC1/StrS family aminotransferase [Nitrosomonadales bacterium]
MTFKYPLATSSWDQKEIDAMHSVIESGNFTMGEKVSLFEKEFSRYIGSQNAVMVNSGSSANLLMIAALFYTKNPKLKLKRGDEVVVPAVSWSTTYYPLYQYGLKIKFVDIDIGSLNYDLTQLELAISNKTRIVLAVNLLGNSNNFDSINKIIKDKDIILLEDNCESMGATFNDKKTGTFGVMGTFSSFYSHHISTMEGGIIVTDDEELNQILISLRSHGWTRELPEKNLICDDKSEDILEESFRFVLPGYNVRPLELEAAVGIEQIKKLPMIISERRKNAKLFVDILQNHPDLIIQKEIGKSSWFGFSIVIRQGSSLTRTQLVNKLTDLEFEFRPIVTGNFLKNEVVKYFDFEISNNLKNAEYIDKNGLFLGNHHYSIKDAFKALSTL